MKYDTLALFMCILSTGCGQQGNLERTVEQGLPPQPAGQVTRVSAKEMLALPPNAVVRRADDQLQRVGDFPSSSNPPDQPRHKK